jgi:Malectin domain
MLKLLLACVILLHEDCNSQAVSVIYAVNIGGPRYTSLNSITYEADPLADLSDQRQSIVEGISGPDVILYRTYRINLVYPGGAIVDLNYTLPVTGDGWYGLVLQMVAKHAYTQDETFAVRLNNYTILSNFHPYTTRKCVEYSVCDTVVYFSICNGVLYYKDQPVELPDKKLTLYLSEYGYLDALLLTKGQAVARKTVIEGLTKLYFDPAQERKCVKS